jgi:hypothetical protein
MGRWDGMDDFWQATNPVAPPFRAMLTTEEVGLTVVAGLGLGLLLALRWIRKRGPVVVDVDSAQDQRDMLLHVLIPIGTFVLCAVVVELGHQPPRRIFGIGLGTLFLMQAILRPPWSWAHRDLGQATYARTVFIVVGTILTLVGVGIL